MQRQEEDEPIQTKPLAEQITPLIRRQADEEKEEPVQTKRMSGQSPEVTPEIASNINNLRRSGEQPLPKPVRDFFEPRFGYDFSQVRIYTDSNATELARVINAKAFTVRQDVVFDTGQYKLGTANGKQLLAHELVHTIQQNGSNYFQHNKPNVTNPPYVAQQKAAVVVTNKVKRERQAFPSISQTTPQIAREDIPGGVPGNGEETNDSDQPNGPFLDLMLVCVREKGGCPQTRSGGFPDDQEMFRYNQQCRQETNYKGPSVKVDDLLCDQPGLAIAHSLKVAYPRWQEILPDCPCTEKGVRLDKSRWKKSNFFISTYHPGAENCFRSKESYPTVEGTSHGQQCCYDCGKLITEGPGAGTPDVWTTFFRHQNIDVAPWKTLGWETYNRFWVPNNDNKCSTYRGRTNDEEKCE